MIEDRIREYLGYDPDTGQMWWKKSPARSVPAGSLIGSSARGGHLKFGMLGKTLLVHRVAWFIFYGSWPATDVDHKDGNGSNNRIENLPLASPKENARNRKRTSETGLKGVYLTISKRSPFKASIYVEDELKHLGYFSTAHAAARAYDRAAIEHFGEFARLNFPGEYHEHRSDGRSSSRPAL